MLTNYSNLCCKSQTRIHPRHTPNPWNREAPRTETCQERNPSPRPYVVPYIAIHIDTCQVCVRR